MMLATNRCDQALPHPTTEAGMNDPRPPADQESPGERHPPSEPEIPLGQRLFDRPFLLLVLGILIMAIFFTGWGLWEITSLTPSPLP
jgi:hypothetical protein